MAGPDRRLVRLAARHFADLQGLRTATSGALLVAASGTWLWTRDVTVAVLAGSGYVLLGLLVMYRLEGYYAASFGRVEQGDKSYRVFIVVSVVAGVFFRRLGSASPYWLVFGAYSAWLLVDGWPYRNHEAFVIVAAMCAWFLGSPSGSPTAERFLLFGFAYFIAGIADHKLLLRITKGQSATMLRPSESFHVDAL